MHECGGHLGNTITNVVAHYFFLLILFFSGVCVYMLCGMGRGGGGGTGTKV